MTRKCNITGKTVQSGNKVSHSNRKSRRRFLPNLQQVSLISDLLAKTIKLRISTHTLRSIEINGGLDNYLLSTSNLKLTTEAQSIRKLLKKASKLNSLATNQQ